MQYSIISILVALTATSGVFAAPTEVDLVARHEAELEARAPEVWSISKRTSCQICEIGIGPFKLSAGDACCSAHCIKDGNKHGGHCNKQKYCICNK